MIPPSLAALAARVRGTVSRGVIGSVDDDKKFQEMQVEFHSDETLDAVEHFQPYGFTARAKKGAEGIGLAVGGLRGHTLMIAVGDRRYRMTGLAEGEVAMHDDQDQVIHLKRDGIEIRGKKLTVDCEDGDIAFTGGNSLFTADQFKVASDDVLLGNGAALGAARKTDAVSSSAITGGSTKVKIA